MDHQDPELDFFSPRFNPLKALRAAALRPPDGRARPLDNIYRCRPLLPPGHPDAAQPAQRAPKTKESLAAAERAKQRTSYVQQQRERARPRVNPIDELAAAVREGPLLLLKTAYQARRRVRVVTRHGRGVRGAAEGTLVAFDKFFNMVLRDVVEAYTVRLWADRPTGPGGAKSRRAPKQEHRRRQLRQVFLRGEHVVLVSMASSPAAAVAPVGPAATAAAAPAVPGGAA